MTPQSNRVRDIEYFSGKLIRTNNFSFNDGVELYIDHVTMEELGLNDPDD